MSLKYDLTGYSPQNDNESCNFSCILKNILNSLPSLKICVLLYFIYSLKEMPYDNLIGFSQDSIFEVYMKIHFPYSCDFIDIPLMMRNSQNRTIDQLLAQIFAICIKLLRSGINFLLNDNFLFLA